MLEPLEQCSGIERPQTRSGKLERQGKSVKTTTDFRCAVVRHEVTANGSRALHQ